MKKDKVISEGFIDNYDGTYSAELKASDEQIDIIYKAALLDNTLTVKDLEYQSLNDPIFKTIVIAAFVKQSLENFILKEQKNAKKQRRTKKSKASKNLRIKSKRVGRKTKRTKRSVLDLSKTT